MPGCGLLRQKESPTLARVGLWFFGGGFGLWDEVFDGVAPFAGDFVRADGADADLHDDSGGQAFDGGAGAGGGFGRRPGSVGGFVLDLKGAGFGHGGPHDVELGGLVAKANRNGDDFRHAGGGDGGGLEGEDARADFGGDVFDGVAGGRLGKDGAEGGSEVVFYEGGGFGLLADLGGVGDAAFEGVGRGDDLGGCGCDSGEVGGVVGEAFGNAPGFGEEFGFCEFVECEDYGVHFVW